MTRKGTKADFIAWLRSKEPRQVVGVPNGAWAPWVREEPWSSEHYCPLGAFHAERGYPVTVGLPDWVLTFMSAVDTQSVEHITAQRALRLLGEA